MHPPVFPWPGWRPGGPHFPPGSIRSARCESAGRVWDDAATLLTAPSTINGHDSRKYKPSPKQALRRRSSNLPNSIFTGWSRIGPLLHPVKGRGEDLGDDFECKIFDEETWVHSGGQPMGVIYKKAKLQDMAHPQIDRRSPDEVHASILKSSRSAISSSSSPLFLESVVLCMALLL